MLPAAHRLRRSDDFGKTVRRGLRAGRSTVVVHLRPRAGDGATMVGLVVSRAVGNAVTRNLVKRRLREIMRSRLVAAPTGSHMVVRALPAAGGASYAALEQDVDRALGRAIGAATRTADR
ncbi:MAG: ribonuclease P protein component [Cellulomonadaceae bacterium]